MSSRLSVRLVPLLLLPPPLLLAPPCLALLLLAGLTMGDGVAPLLAPAPGPVLLPPPRYEARSPSPNTSPAPLPPAFCSASFCARLCAAGVSPPVDLMPTEPGVRLDGPPRLLE